MDLIGPGLVDIAYYGTTAGDPNSVNATWNVYLAKSTNGLSGTPTFGVKKAVAAIHMGAIESSNGSSDRSLLDFFQLAVDSSGNANIVYTAGQQTGTDLFFVKEQ
jgi:hypothetical protein